MVGAFNPFTFKVTQAPKPEARGSGREELPHDPTPEARGSGREEQPMPEARGGNEVTGVRGHGRQPGGDTPRQPEAKSGGGEEQPHD